MRTRQLECACRIHVTARPPRGDAANRRSSCADPCNAMRGTPDAHVRFAVVRCCKGAAQRWLRMSRAPRFTELLLASLLLASSAFAQNAATELNQRCAIRLSTTLLGKSPTAT